MGKCGALAEPQPSTARAPGAINNGGSGSRSERGPREGNATKSGAAGASSCLALMGVKKRLLRCPPLNGSLPK